MGDEATPMLQRMDEGRIFVIERCGGQFRIYENCDVNFSCVLTAQEMHDLGAEMIALSVQARATSRALDTTQKPA